MNRTLLTFLFGLLFLSLSKAQFSLQQNLGYVLDEIEGIKIADFDGDGLSDIVTFTNKDPSWTLNPELQNQRISVYS